MKKAGKKTGIILAVIIGPALAAVLALLDRKSTRLNSSH